MRARNTGDTTTLDRPTCLDLIGQNRIHDSEPSLGRRLPSVCGESQRGSTNKLAIKRSQPLTVLRRTTQRRRRVGLPTINDRVDDRLAPRDDTAGLIHKVSWARQPKSESLEGDAYSHHNYYFLSPSTEDATLPTVPGTPLFPLKFKSFQRSAISLAHKRSTSSALI